MHRGYLSASQTQLMTSRDLDLKYNNTPPVKATFDSCRDFINLMEEEKKEEEP